jgi:hypothetical protein
MKSKLFLIVPVLALAPFGLNAQSTQGQSTTQAQSQTQAQAQLQTNAQAQARIDAAMKAAARSHISASLLESKVEEGQAKQVPPQRIAAAVEARLEALQDAQQTMTEANIEHTSDAELSVAADALQAGVSENALIKVYHNAPPERRVVAVAVLTDLVRLGGDSQQSVARVSAALGSSVALANLQAEVASQLRLGGLSSTLDATGIVKIH